MEADRDGCLRLDLGCGPNKRPGFVGVDVLPFPGVDVVHDLRQPWPWEAETVDEAFSSHFIEHLTGTERIHFFNELYRVLKTGARAQIVCPHWAHESAYGDPTHQWPPVTPWTFYYLDKEWRARNAPHVPYTCDFTSVVAGRHGPGDEWLENADPVTRRIRMTRNVNTTLELVVQLTKR